MHFDKSMFEMLFEEVPQLERIGQIATEDELITCQKMIASFITQSPEERYVKLIDTRPELFQRVPQQYIASYIGVSPETLSRIKKRVALKVKGGRKLY
jgi:CRP-like cAMP-binding protein